MIWDCFMFGGERELDLLELRLRTLGPYVDRFVIAEAEITFQRDPKPLAYPAAEARFAAWADRIEYIGLTAAELPEGDNPWLREYAQRDATLRPLTGAAPDDTVLMGDLDEIPDLSGWAPAPHPQVFNVRQHVFAVDWQHPKPLLATAAVPWGMHRDDSQSYTWAATRKYRLDFPQHHGGWHFSWLGGPDAIAAKTYAHCHHEHNEEIRALAAENRLHGGGWVPWDHCQQYPVTVDRTWPEWIRERKCPPSWFRP